MLWLLMACGNESKLQHVREAPEVHVLAPTEDEIFRQGQGDIALSGTAVDSYDKAGTLKAEWQVDGGTVFSAKVASDGSVVGTLPDGSVAVGAHVATLSVTDSDGDQAEASVDFSVGGPLGPPVVTLSAPADGTSVESGVALTFSGDATDASTPAADLVFHWTSSLSGDLNGAITADGRSVLPDLVLADGDHLITLSVTDTDGETGSASIHVSVNHVIEPGDLVFSEMMIDPQVVDDTVGEWIEMYNTSSADLDIGGYTLRDDDVDHWELAGPLVVPGHGYVVFCANMDPLTNGGVPCDGSFLRDSTGLGMALANGPDEVVLARPDGVEIDWLHYDDTWYTPGVALGVDPQFRDGNANDDVTHWCNQSTVMTSGGEAGTPGAANDPCGL